MKSLEKVAEESTHSWWLTPHFHQETLLTCRSLRPAYLLDPGACQWVCQFHGPAFLSRLTSRSGFIVYSKRLLCTSYVPGAGLGHTHEQGEQVPGL